jgi:hypothetical protein
MIDNEFYFFDKGSFGELRGYRKVKIPTDVQQSMLDDNTRTRLHSFSPPPGLSPGEYGAMFTDAFLKARSASNEQPLPTQLFVIDVQVGNSESLNEIHIIENHELFSHWENDQVVQQFKVFSNKYLSE